MIVDCLDIDIPAPIIIHDHVRPGPYDLSKSNISNSTKTLPTSSKLGTAKYRGLRSRTDVTRKGRIFRDWNRRDEDEQGKPLPAKRTYLPGLQSKPFPNFLPLGAHGRRHNWNQDQKKNWPPYQKFQLLDGAHGSMIEAHPSGEILLLHIKNGIPQSYCVGESPTL